MAAQDGQAAGPWRFLRTDSGDLVETRPVLVLEHDHVRAGVGDPAHQGGTHRRTAGQREVLEDPGHRPQQLREWRQ